MLDVPAMFSPGEVVGTYVIERRLGAGGFGEVFLARERLPNRRVALKVVRPEFAADPLFAARFEREVDALAAVEHPNVVPIYAHGRRAWPQYFSMRYVEGGSLDALLVARRPSLHDVIEVLAGVAEGLDHCHVRGIVHRDLKPANMLVDSVGGRALLADFGIALARSRDDHRPGSCARHARVHGPRDADGRPSDARERSLGPRRGGLPSGHRGLPRGLSEPPDTESVPPSRRNASLGPDVDRVILRALSLDPRAAIRGRAFVADLREALQAADASDGRADSTQTRFAALAGAPRELRSSWRRWRRSASPRSSATRARTRPGGDCHPSYTGACLKPDSLDYDCKGGNGDGPDYIRAAVRVVGPDDYGLDRDGDGEAC